MFSRNSTGADIREWPSVNTNQMNRCQCTSASQPLTPNDCCHRQRRPTCRRSPCSDRSLSWRCAGPCVSPPPPSSRPGRGGRNRGVRTTVGRRVRRSGCRVHGPGPAGIGSPGTPNFVVVASVGEPQVDRPARVRPSTTRASWRRGGAHRRLRRRGDRVLGRWFPGRSLSSAARGTRRRAPDPMATGCRSPSRPVSVRSSATCLTAELGYPGRAVFGGLGSDRMDPGHRRVARPAPNVLLLVVVFGGLVAPACPWVGAVSVLGTFFSLWMVTLFTDVSISRSTSSPPSAWVWPSITALHRQLVPRDSPCPRSHWAPDEHRAVPRCCARWRPWADSPRCPR